jgi:O-antigen ligase
MLGVLQIERGYMLVMLVFWLVWPHKTFTNNRIHMAIAMLFGTIGISWMLSPYPAEGEIVFEMYAKVMVFYVLLITSVRTDQDVRRLAYLFVAVYAVYILHSLRDYCFCSRYTFTQGVARMMGIDITFADPNQFATAILVSMPMVVACLTMSGSFVRMLLLGQLGLTGLCIFLTCSRAGIVGMGFFLFLVVIFSKRRILGFTLLIVLAMVIMAALPGYVYNRIMTLIDPDAGPAGAQSSAQGRLQGLTKGIELLQAYPLAGVGPGAFGKATAKGFQAHNLYGQCAGELGTLGVIALGFLIFCFLANWWRAVRIGWEFPHLKETASYRVLRAVGMGVLMLMLNGMAGHTLYRYNWVWFAAFQVVALRVLSEHAAVARSAVSQEEYQPTWETLPEEPVEPQPAWGY